MFKFKSVRKIKRVKDMKARIKVKSPYLALKGSHRLENGFDVGFAMFEVTSEGEIRAVVDIKFFLTRRNYYCCGWFHIGHNEEYSASAKCSDYSEYQLSSLYGMLDQIFEYDHNFTYGHLQSIDDCKDMIEQATGKKLFLYRYGR